MQVIESDAESGDCVSIEREQPSTAFKPMPAYGVDSVVARQVGHQTPDSYIKIGDILPPFKADELTGTFNALYKTTNFVHVKRYLVEQSYGPIFCRLHSLECVNG